MVSPAPHRWNVAGPAGPRLRRIFAFENASPGRHGGVPVHHHVRKDSGALHARRAAALFCLVHAHIFGHSFFLFTVRLLFETRFRRVWGIYPTLAEHLLRYMAGD